MARISKESKGGVGMELERVIIIGCAGAGKSTLSRQLGDILQLPVIHLDKYYWQADWVATPHEQWDAAVAHFTLGERWIIDGNYTRTLDIRMQRADLIIYLDMSRWTCLYRVIKRRIMYHGKSRPDMNAANAEKLDWDFLLWVWNYRKRSRGKTLEKLRNVREGQKVVIVNDARQLAAFVEELMRSRSVGAGERA